MMGDLKVARRSHAVVVLAMLLGVAGVVGIAGVAGCAGGFGGAADAGADADADAVDLGDAGGLSSADATVSAQDSAAIAQLAEIAARDAKPDGPAGVTECWAPSQNPVPEEPSAPGDDGVDGGGGNREGGSAFRVICRVHFEQQGSERYRDMICIGNLGRDPVAEYCYQWAYYADTPKFEDRPAFTAAGSR